MEKYTQPGKKSIPPSALVVFTHGVDAHQKPMIVPNGGCEEVDNQIVAWFEALFTTARSPRKAAA
jgi:hypothetical protein